MGGPRQEDMGILKELAQALASYTAELETYRPEDLRDPKKYFGALSSSRRARR